MLSRLRSKTDASVLAILNSGEQLPDFLSLGKKANLNQRPDRKFRRGFIGIPAAAGVGVLSCSLAPAARKLNLRLATGEAQS